MPNAANETSGIRENRPRLVNGSEVLSEPCGGTRAERSVRPHNSGVGRGSYMPDWRGKVKPGVESCGGL